LPFVIPAKTGISPIYSPWLEVVEIPDKRCAPSGTMGGRAPRSFLGAGAGGARLAMTGQLEDPLPRVKLDPGSRAGRPAIASAPPPAVVDPGRS
jgi:hypothetical protein